MPVRLQTDQVKTDGADCPPRAGCTPLPCVLGDAFRVHSSTFITSSRAPGVQHPSALDPPWKLREILGSQKVSWNGGSCILPPGTLISVVPLSPHPSANPQRIAGGRETWMTKSLSAIIGRTGGSGTPLSRELAVKGPGTGFGLAEWRLGCVTAYRPLPLVGR